jgi:tetratricopeptide (TPR) repeat protein
MTLNLKSNKNPRGKTSLCVGVLCLAISFTVLSCVRQQGTTLIDSALEHEEKREFEKAIGLYEKAFKTSANKEEVLVAAQKIQELSYLHTKEYRKAIHYLDYYIANVSSFSEVIAGLKRKAYIEHKMLNFYEAATVTYQRLLSSSKLDPKEEETFRLEVARCQFSINKFDQALLELDTLLKQTEDNEIKLSAIMLQFSVYQAQGNDKKALESTEIAAKMPFLTDEHKKDIAFNRAILLEHQEKYADALKALETLQEPGDAVEEKKEQLRRLEKFQRSRKR